MRAMFLITLAVAALAAHSRGSAEPPWMDWVLAGYSLDHGSVVGIYDKERNYYLLRDFACDGADVTISLTRDRNYACDEGFYVPNFKPTSGENGTQKLTHKPLRSLSTSLGVTIGDTAAQLVQRLGPPTKRQPSGSRDQFLDYLYRWREGKGDDAVLYEETYTFKQGRLIEIIFSKQPD